MKFLNSLFLTRFFFLLFSAVIVCVAMSFKIPSLLFWGKVGGLSLVGFTILDAMLLFSSKEPITFERIVDPRLNLGDANEIEIILKNTSQQSISFDLIEGYPVQMQERSKVLSGSFAAGATKSFTYSFTPKLRGEYVFGNAMLIISSVFNLAGRKLEFDAKTAFRVYPSVVQMKKYELLVFQQQKLATGIKRIRRLGNNSEFEQIKNYVQGDEIKSINWKATSRGRELMVNQYQEEKAQHVYCIIDKSRSMQVEFDRFSMLDYSINSTLVLSNIMLKKGDKTGLITFSDKIGSQLAPDKSNGQMRRIMELLYNQKTHFKDANFELLFEAVRKTVKFRSLLLLFTNFETESSMRRALPLLRTMNQKHVLVLVFFKNNELEEMAFQKPKTIRDIYQSTVAEKMISVKNTIALELKKNGIHTILTRPEDLSMNAINKYLELKAKGAV